MGLNTHLGIDSCFALNRWTEPEKWTEIISKELGLKYTQFYFDMLDPVLIGEPDQSRLAKQICDAADTNGIKIIATTTGQITHQTNLLLHPDLGARQWGMHWCEEALKLTSQLNAEGCMFILGSYTLQDLNDLTRRNYLLDFMIEAVQQLSISAKQLGHKFLLIEPCSILREYPATIQDAYTLVDRLNQKSSIPVKLNLDVGHLNITSKSLEDGDPYVWLRELGALAHTVHLQQTDGKASRHWTFTEMNNAQGIIQPEKVINALEKSGAKDVFLIFELFFSPFGYNDNEVISQLQESIQYWLPFTSV